MKVSRGAKDAIKSAAAKGQGKLARAIHKKASKTGRRMLLDLRKVNGGGKLSPHRTVGGAHLGGIVKGSVNTALAGGALVGGKKLYDKGRDMQERRTVKGRIKQTIRKKSQR